MMLFQNFFAGLNHVLSAVGIAQEFAESCCDALLIDDPQGSSCRAELRGEGFKISRVRPDQDGAVLLERLEQVLSPMID